MKISVIITSYRNKPYLRQAIESVLNQTHAPHELIVIDDGSPDDSYGHLVELNNEFPFKLLRFKHNRGQSAARNFAMEQATGDWVNFMDGDDYMYLEKLEHQVKTLREGVDVSYTDSAILKGDLILGYPMSDLAPAGEGEMFAHLLRRNCIAIHAAITRLEVARKLKFNEELRQAEDYDFWLRVAQTGAKFQFVNEPLVVYRKTREGKSEQKVDSVDAALKVLAQFDTPETTGEARANLNEEMADLLEDRGEALLMKLRRSGLDDWRRADGIRAVRGHKRAVLKLALRHDLLALGAFPGLHTVARLKHYRANAKIRKFSK